MTSICESPTRWFMDDSDIVWNNGKPDYSKTDELYLNERTKKHLANSLEKTVENVVKTFEMELVHKADPSKWKSIDHSVEFFMQTNGGHKYTIPEIKATGHYRTFLWDAPLFDANLMTRENVDLAMRKAFPGGFAWEVLELLSGLPRPVITWRHWAYHTGDYYGSPPSGEKIEMFGSTDIQLNSEAKIQSLKFYFDPTAFLGKLTHFDTKDWTGCPYIQNNNSF